MKNHSSNQKEIPFSLREKARMRGYRLSSMFLSPLPNPLGSGVLLRPTAYIPVGVPEGEGAELDNTESDEAMQICQAPLK